MKLFEIKMIITRLLSTSNIFPNFFLRNVRKAALFYHFSAEQLNFQLEKVMFYQVLLFCIQEVSARVQDPVLHITFPGSKNQLERVQRAAPAASTWNNPIHPFQVTREGLGRGDTR